MSKRLKGIRTKGKLRLSRYFQKFKEGDVVSVVKERSVQASFPERIQGRTGRVSGQRGSAYIVRVRGMSKEKQFLIKPIHLRKMESEKAQEQGE